MRPSGSLLAALLVGLLALPAAAPAAPSPTISGLVTTRDDGLPLPGATVAIESLALSVSTDAAGRYLLTLPEDQVGKQVELKVMAPGVAVKTVRVRVADGPTTLDVPMGLAFHEEITVGSRAAGAQAEKAVPVDILTARQIEATGAVETMQVLQALAPSFNFPRPTISDGTDSIRPATLRGLGPDHVLVLVNGKRRHPTALVHINNTVGRGATGVDLNAIPVSSIERIEILRDGAAAQYGSDAIAGVINIVLKSGAAPLTFSGRAGFNKGSFNEVLGTERDFSDGGTYDLDASHGWAVGRGSFNLAAEFRRREGTNRAGFDTRDQLRPGDALNHTVPQPNTHWGDSEETNYLAFLNATFPINRADTAFFYAFGGFGRRTGVHGGNYRRGLDTTNWPQIYPLGFLPLIEPTIVDSSVAAGLRGVRSEWVWDVSAEYGRNRLDYDITNSLNVSLGPTIPPNRTEFYSGAIASNQLVFNADLSRALKLARLAGPLNVAVGAEFRRETYQIIEGEPDSWRDAGARNQAGGPGTPGAQVFPGFRPTNAIDISRHNAALYVDLEGDVLSRLRVGAAGRFEDYSDFGSTTDGKLTARLEVDKRFVLRAAAQTGFRAPSLAQSHFSTVSTNFTLVGGTFVPLEVVTAPVTSEIARILGATALQPEQSVNLSAGAVLTPVDGLDFTFDYYRIRIDDRVVLSGNFGGGSLANLLRTFGAGQARYFTNAVDTRTSGFDVIANWRRRFVNGADVRVQAAYNHTETTLLRISDTPPELAQFLQRSQFEAILFNNTEERRFTCGQPKDNLRFTFDWSKGRLGALLRESRYGEYCSIEDLPSPTATAQVFEAEWLTDVELMWRAPRFSLGAGVHNLFSTLPDTQIAATAFNNIRTFPRNAPFGFNGRYLYAKATVRF